MVNKILTKPKHISTPMIVLSLTISYIIILLIIWLIAKQVRKTRAPERVTNIHISETCEKVIIENSKQPHVKYRVEMDFSLLETDLPLLDTKQIAKFGPLCSKSIKKCVSLKNLITQSPRSPPTTFEHLMGASSNYILHYKQVAINCFNPNIAREIENGTNSDVTSKGILNIILSQELLGFFLTLIKKFQVFFKEPTSQREDKTIITTHIQSSNDFLNVFGKDIKIYYKILIETFKMLINYKQALLRLYKIIRPNENPLIYKNTKQIIDSFTQYITILPAFFIVDILTFYFDISIVKQTLMVEDVKIKPKYKDSEMYGYISNELKEIVKRRTGLLINNFEFTTKLYLDLLNKQCKEPFIEIHKVVVNIDDLIYKGILQDFNVAFRKQKK